MIEIKFSEKGKERLGDQLDEVTEAIMKRYENYSSEKHTHGPITVSVQDVNGAWFVDGSCLWCGSTISMWREKK